MNIFVLVDNVKVIFFEFEENFWEFDCCKIMIILKTINGRLWWELRIIFIVNEFLRSENIKNNINFINGYVVRYLIDNLERLSGWLVI